MRTCSTSCSWLNPLREKSLLKSRGDSSLFGKRPVPRQAHDESIEEVLALNLISARREREMTQEALGRRSGVSMYVIAHIERQARNPSLQTLAKLCVPLQCTL
ncbi:MAG: helix-turn-helix domain-containing protein, partial [Pseudomonas stutzeri]|nr:helix-turn-helix domain-containing protein [Stutzerimonas stutzeri]